MIAKCPCQQCGVNIEFDIEQADHFVACPSCNQQTRLLLPRTPKKFLSPEEKEGEKIYFSGDATAKNEWGFWMRVGIVAAVMFFTSLIGMITAYQLGEIPDSFFGGVVLGSIFFAFGFVVTGFWIMFPVIVWEKLSQIERNTRQKK